MSSLQHFIQTHRGAALKLLLRNYRKRMRKRTEAECRRRWAPYGGADVALLRELAAIHELPNPYIYPSDRAILYFANPYMDFRDVETMRLLQATHPRAELTPENLLLTLDTPPLRYLHQLL